MNERDFPIPGSASGYLQAVDKVPRWGSRRSHRVSRKEKSVSIVMLGIDLTKSVLDQYGLNEACRVVFKATRPLVGVRSVSLVHARTTHAAERSQELKYCLEGG